MTGLGVVNTTIIAGKTAVAETFSAVLKTRVPGAMLAPVKAGVARGAVWPTRDWNRTAREQSAVIHAGVSAWIALRSVFHAAHRAGKALTNRHQIA